MSNQSLSGKRVLVTQADMFMGPVLCEVFANHGATVIASTDPLVRVGAPAFVVAEAGQVDVLIANLAIPAPTTAATDVSEEEWNDTFAALVHPLSRLFRAVLPAMIERRAGKILVMGSASALRGMKRASTYSAARGAQLACVQAVGLQRTSELLCRASLSGLRRLGGALERVIPNHSSNRACTISRADHLFCR